MERVFDIFRHNPDGRLVFVGSAQTLQSSHQLVRSTASAPTERFAIYNVFTREITYLSADGSD
jgi:hypothetical protein